MKRLELFEADRQKRSKEMPALKLHLVSHLKRNLLFSRKSEECQEL